jgi:hypothetical protein
MASSQSQITLQNLFDDLVAHGDLDPGWDEAGYTVRPIISVANKTMEDLCGGEGMFPWKWNQFNLPLFVYNSWQQDYALVGQPGMTAVDGDPSTTNLAWLQEGIAIDINNPRMPKPQSWIEVGRNQSRSTGGYVSNSVFVQPLARANYLANNLLYYGTWGAPITGNSTWGNNPQANQLISTPFVSGAPMPQNPILQIRDANANLLVLTTYGTTGGSPPSAAPASPAGTQVTDGTVKWTVVDPYGQGIRLTPVPSQTGTVWQVYLVGQMKPTKFTGATSLSTQTLFPMTDDFYHRFLDGCVAECYRFNPLAKTRANYLPAKKAWIESLLSLKRESDRELELRKIRPKRTIIGAGGSRNSGNLGPYWPFGGPVT